MAHNHNSHFANPAAIASYIENARRNVPGLDDLHRMVMLLLAETNPGPAHILVVGAGGGMETRAMAETQPAWRFTGVDPSAAMLDLARQTLAPWLIGLCLWKAPSIMRLRDPMTALPAF